MLKFKKRFSKLVTLAELQRGRSDWFRTHHLRALAFFGAIVFSDCGKRETGAEIQKIQAAIPIVNYYAFTEENKLSDLSGYRAA